MPRTFTLRGAAAGAFVEAQAGMKPRTDLEKYERIATFVHLNMQVNKPEVAAMLLRHLVEDGLDATVALLTAEKRPAPKPKRAARASAKASERL